MDSSDNKCCATPVTDEEVYDLVLRLDNCNVHSQPRTSTGKTGLICAVILGLCSLMEKLISKGMNIESRDDELKTALHYAAENQHSTDALDVLIKHGANLEARDIKGQTPLHVATNDRNAEVAEKLLDAGADVNAIDDEGNTPLHLAIRKGVMPLIKVLLRHPGVELNTFTHEGETPLMLASTWPEKEYAEEVLSAGANVQATCLLGITALHFAAAFSSTNVVDLLLQSGANVHAADYRGQTALHCAARLATSSATTRLLIANGANRDARDDIGQTPMFLAAREGNVVICRDLLSLFANSEIPDHNGRLPIDVAYDLEHIEVVILFEFENVPAG